MMKAPTPWLLARLAMTKPDVSDTSKYGWVGPLIPTAKIECQETREVDMMRKVKLFC